MKVQIKDTKWLALALPLMLAGCGGGGEETTNAGSTQPSPVYSQPWYDYDVDGDSFAVNKSQIVDGVLTDTLSDFSGDFYPSDTEVKGFILTENAFLNDDQLAANPSKVAFALSDNGSTATIAPFNIENNKTAVVLSANYSVTDISGQPLSADVRELFGLSVAQAEPFRFPAGSKLLNTVGASQTLSTGFYLGVLADPSLNYSERLNFYHQVLTTNGCSSLYSSNAYTVSLFGGKNIITNDTDCSGAIKWLFSDVNSGSMGSFNGVGEYIDSASLAGEADTKAYNQTAHDAIKALFIQLQNTPSE